MSVTERDAEMGLPRGLDSSRGLDLYSGVEPELDDIVINGAAIEAMLESIPRTAKHDSNRK